MFFSYVYGGFDGTFGPAGVQFDEVWVLSLPAFRWFKADYTAVSPRMGHTCHVVGHRQLLTIGGVDPMQTDLVTVWKGPDRFSQGLGIFDMSAMTWASYYNASAAGYVRPEAVKAWYDKKYVALQLELYQILRLVTQGAISYHMGPTGFERPH